MSHFFCVMRITAASCSLWKRETSLASVAEVRKLRNRVHNVYIGQLCLSELGGGREGLGDALLR